METRTALSTPHAFRREVEELGRAHGVEGAVLASRDGLLLVNAFPSLPQPEVFCAMHAAALGAAEMALRGIDGAGVSLIADVGERRFFSRAVNDSLFVVVAVAADADCHSIAAWMDGLAGRMTVT